MTVRLSDVQGTARPAREAAETREAMLRDAIAAPRARRRS